MTTVFEVHFTEPADWISEFHADVERDRVESNIVRIALRTGQAKVGQLGGPPSPQDAMPAVYYISEMVEASYISASRQLVKLSAYCGVTYTGPFGKQWGQEMAVSRRPHVDARHAALNDATHQRVQQVYQQLKAAIQRHPAIALRTGVLAVEEGTWMADPEHPIRSNGEDDIP